MAATEEIEIIFFPKEWNTNTTTSFSGQKTCHPFTMDKRKYTKTRYVGRGKNRTRKEETIVSRSYGKEFLSQKLARLIMYATLSYKFDGSCGLIRVYKEGHVPDTCKLHYISNGVAYVPYRRHDIKKDKSGKWKMPDAMTDEWIPCEPKPTDEKANHWPHFRPLDAALGDKWYISAFKHAITNYDTSLLPTSDFSVEYMGPHIQNCKTDPLVRDTFIPHGCVEVRMSAGERNFDGFRNFFANHPIGTAIEGVVAYCADGSYRKIRRDS